MRTSTIFDGSPAARADDVRQHIEPSMTLPHTVYCWFKLGYARNVMKNCEPFEWARSSPSENARRVEVQARVELETELIAAAAGAHVFVLGWRLFDPRLRHEASMTR